jgi:hypothetical protein
MPVKVALHSSEWRALAEQLQQVRVLRDRAARALHLLGPPTPATRERGETLCSLLTALDAKERLIRARLPFDPSGL